MLSDLDRYCFKAGARVFGKIGIIGFWWSASVEFLFFGGYGKVLTWLCCLGVYHVPESLSWEIGF